MDRAASAAAPAVEVRSTSAPNRTAWAPAARKATTSPSVSPPSGPTTTAMVPERGMSTSASRRRARSCSTTARSVSPSSPQPSRVVIGAVTSGSRGRRDCLLAARAAARHLATPFSTRSSRHRVTQRAAVQGTIRSTPSSVARSTASGPRSPFGSACTSTNSGPWAGTSNRADTATRRPSAPAETTEPSATVPCPSPTRTCSPDVRRSTSTACRPSSPSTNSSSPSGRTSSRKSGAPSSSGTPTSGVVMSASVERVADLGEQPALRLPVGLGLVLPAQRGELAQELLLLGVQSGRCGHLDVHEQVAPPGAAQPRRPVGPQRQHAAGLGARPDVEVLLAVQCLQAERGAERRGGHRESDPAVQVLAVPGEHVVRSLVDLDVEVAGRSAPGADLALAGQPDPHTVLDARGHLDRDGAARANPAVAGALGARRRDDLAGARARGADPAGHDLAEEAALDALHLTPPRTGRARDGVGARRGAGPGTDRAEDGGVDGEVLGDAEDRLVQLELDGDERVAAGAGAAAGSAGGRAAEEGVHDVAEPAEAGAAEPTGPAATARVERVAAEVDDAALLGVAQRLVGAGDLLEALLGTRVGVDVGVQVAGHLAVGALDLGVTGIAGHAQHAEVVGRHRVVSASALGQQVADVAGYGANRGHVPWIVHAGGSDDAETAEGTVRAAVPDGDEGGPGERL